MILDQDLDRLADGELSPAERRELLQALESSPTDWRRCALAFVESQVLREEFRALTGESPACATVDRRPRSVLAAGGWLALAATLLGVAFLAGSLNNDIAAPGDAPLLAGGEEPPMTALPGPEEVDAAIAHRQQRVDQPDPDVVTFWTKDESGGRRSLRAKLVDADELDSELGVRFRSAIPPEVRRQYEQHGYRFQSRQRYAPLNMDNGRVLVVPVEDLQVAPVSDDYL
ncbi:hypothetical protein Pla123a_02030 [Posidoniimonas polymericola]|uniref:Uncharacterized protein n=1 Tax=Posidoniimonas polymericola TaxID=2528002 RepID=A0A5C5ZE20_9BACT|nr:hypothetical protein [Posidoniimonas polymericola]TWT85396.1 hypothetical protein Pla123a_02030 [Posidoniimonas polymericola]